MTDAIPRRAADLWATYTVGTGATPQAQVWGWANTISAPAWVQARDPLVDAFAQLHEAAVALKEAWA